MQTPRPLTPTALAARIDAATPGRLRQVKRVVTDSSLTPRALHEPYSKSDWRALSDAERLDNARRVIRGQLFDSLVETRGVTLTPAERAELLPAR